MNTPLARAEKAIKEYNGSTLEQEIKYWRDTFKRKPPTKTLDLNRLHLFLDEVVPLLFEEMKFLKEFYQKHRDRVDI